METALQIPSKISRPSKREPSWLLNYLPGIYAEDALSPDGPFLDRFLRIFESILDPLDQQLDVLYAYFDPSLTPAEFLPWLASWVDLVLDENWDEKRRRELLRYAAELYRRRGTAGELRDYLRICTGVEPRIFEDSGSLRQYLAHETDISAEDLEEVKDRGPFHFSVVMVAGNDTIRQNILQHQDRIRRIIEEEKPAHTIYTLYILGKK